MQRSSSKSKYICFWDLESFSMFWKIMIQQFHSLKSVFFVSSTFSKTIFDFPVRFAVILLLDQGKHWWRTWNYGRSNEKIEDFSLKMYCSQNILTLSNIFIAKKVSWLWCDSNKMEFVAVFLQWACLQPQIIGEYSTL